MGWDKTFPSALGKSHSLRDTIVCKVMRSVSYTWKSLVSHVHVRENVMCLYQLPGIWLTEIQFTLPTCGTQQLVKILSVIFLYKVVWADIYAWHKASIRQEKSRVFRTPMHTLSLFHLQWQGWTHSCVFAVLFWLGQKTLFLFKTVQIIGERWGLYLIFL